MNSYYLQKNLLLCNCFYFLFTDLVILHDCKEDCSPEVATHINYQKSQSPALGALGEQRFEFWFLQHILPYNNKLMTRITFHNYVDSPCPYPHTEVDAISIMKSLE
jgi:hypothetical protein